MMRSLFLFLLTGFSCLVANAQSVKATELMKSGQYAEAVVLFEKAVSSSNPEYTDLTGLAYCYIMLHDFVKAEGVYERIVLHRNKESVQHFYYGEVLKINKKYQKAKEQYSLYAGAYPDDYKAKQRIASCDSLALWDQGRTKWSVGTLTGINTSADEMFPWPVGNNLFFSSNSRTLLTQCGGSCSFRDPLISFIFSFDGNKISRKKFSFSDSMSLTGYLPAYGADVLMTKTIVVTPTGETLSPTRVQTGKNGSFNVFLPEGVSSEFIYSHASLAAGGMRMYFVSNMSGGFGGTDIYYSDFTNQKWGPPVNLGATINTAGDEMFPYVLPNDSLLFFASDGHPGYGNMDIFVSCSDQGTWRAPVNLKSPVNGIGNDFCMVFNEYPYSGYMVSNRYPESKGGNDIFSVSFERPVIVTPPDTVTPFVYRSDPNELYVFFETGSSEINASTLPLIDSLSGLLKKYSYLNISVSSFADVRGPEGLNQELLSARANALVMQLEKSGVAKSQIRLVPGKISSDRQLPNLQYHVQLGFTSQAGQEAYYVWRTYEKFDVKSLKKNRGYAYFTGTGTLAEMQTLCSQINSQFGLNAYVIASYRNTILEDIYLAPNRRVELRLENNKTQ